MRQSSRMRSTTLGLRSVESIKHVVLTSCGNLRWQRSEEERQ